jgi:type I restriction enzyme, S subunit
MSEPVEVTKTGGRDATTRHIPPTLALAVGMPSTPAPNGWQWTALTKVARMESGHTPSRKHPEYWGGTIPWIGIQDAKSNHGRRIRDTHQKTNELGIANSSARILPANTVCLSRTASVGYVVVMGRPMATSQDFVNWVCSKDLDPDFLKYLFIAEDENLLRFSSGAVHQTIYFPEAKAFHICHPPLPEQRRIVGILDEAFDGIATAKANAEKNLQNARAVFESHLNAVFTERGKGWVEKRLVDIAKVFGRGKSRHRPRNEPSLYGGKYPFVQTGDIRNADHVIDSYTQTYSELGLAQSRLWPAGTVCITIAANIAETAILGVDACFPDSVIGVVVDEKQASNGFLQYLLESFKTHLQAQGKGSAQANINMGTFEDQRFPFPSIAVQQKIVGTLDSLRNETQHLQSIYQRKLAALDELKKSLLDQAFRGDL